MAAGVTGNWFETDEGGVKTGMCGCLIVGTERTLCVNIGAAKKIPTSHVEE